MTSDVDRSKQQIELKMFQFTFLSLVYTLNNCIWVSFCFTYLNPYIILHQPTSMESTVKICYFDCFLVYFCFQYRNIVHNVLLYEMGFIFLCNLGYFILENVYQFQKLELQTLYLRMFILNKHWKFSSLSLFRIFKLQFIMVDPRDALKTKG